MQRARAHACRDLPLQGLCRRTEPAAGADKNEPPYDVGVRRGDLLSDAAAGRHPQQIDGTAERLPHPLRVLGGDLRHRDPARHSGAAVQVEDLSTVSKELGGVLMVAAHRPGRDAGLRHQAGEHDQGPARADDQARIRPTLPSRTSTLSSCHLQYERSADRTNTTCGSSTGTTTRSRRAATTAWPRGGGGGHLDLPRMRSGGVRGGIFAVFTSLEPATARMSRSDAMTGVPSSRSRRELGSRAPRPTPPRPPAGSSRSSARVLYASRARSPTSTGSGRRRSAGHGAAFRRRGGHRHRAREPRYLVRRRPAFARPGLEPAQRLRPRRAVHLPVLARHRPWPDRRRRVPCQALRRARHRRRPQPPQRGRVLGRRPARRRAVDGQPRGRARALPLLAQPDRRQLDAVAQSGGLVGIVFACFFLRADFRTIPTRRSS